MVTVAGATFQTEQSVRGHLDIFYYRGFGGKPTRSNRVERRFDKWRPKVGADQ